MGSLGWVENAFNATPLKQGDSMIRLQAADCGGGRPEVANHEPGEGGQERVSVQRTENLKMDGMDGEAGENTDVTFYNPTHMCHSETAQSSPGA